MLRVVLATTRRWVILLLFNAALAALIQSAAPTQPKLTDRAEYDYNSVQPLADFCPHTIYCYRVLVPMLLAPVPLEPEWRWRGLQWLAHTATGTIVAVAAMPAGSPWIASVLLQGSYAFTFTAYDPYTPDPVVFLIAALLLYCWIRDRALAATLIAVVFVFAKETVALIAVAPAIAVMVFHDRPARWRWLVPAALAWVTLLTFHWYMDTYAGWGIARNPAASFSTGSWLALWWKNNPSLILKGLIVFSTFGFAWLFALLGYRHASPAVRQLAVGAAAPLLGLAYVQTPERALGNAFFVIVPLAAAFLSRVTPAAAWAAAITNALVTAKIGLSTDWLPSTTILMLPASLSAAWAVASSRRRHRISS
jgi:hypothetical protein